MVHADTYQQFQYVILDGRPNQSKISQEFHNRAYTHWKSVWERILNRLDGAGAFKADDFTRYPFVTVLFRGDEVVAQICCRQLFLDHVITNDITYFAEFKGKALENLNARNAKSLLTIELNSIGSKYSRRKSGFPFVEAMFQLCGKLAAHIEADACTAVPRKITGVQNSLTEMGFVTLENDLLVHDCPVDIMLGYTSELRPYNDANVSAFVEYQWRTRVQN